jgi:outer membrane protein assembly factor BamB
VLSLAAWTAGCEGGEGNAPPALSEAEIQHLEALGYADWAEESAGDGATGVVAWDRERAPAGYNLITYALLHRAEFVDMEGRVMRAWAGEGKGRWHRAILAANGDLVVAGQEGRGDERRHLLVRLAFDGTPLWRRYLPVHHHLTERTDGKIAALTRRQRWLPSVLADLQVADNGIVLVSPDGEFVQERSLHDMLAARPDVFAFLSQESGSAPPDPDFLHANFIDWMDREDLAERDPIYALSNVLVTVRDQNTLAIFDWDRGEVVWAWGQGELLQPHGAGVIGNGNILVFDNRPGEEASRVVELDPLAGKIVWEYTREGFYSETRGTVQRLENGNTFIGESNDGRALEITRDGEIVWEYRTPHRNEKAQPAALWIERLQPTRLEGLLP